MNNILPLIILILTTITSSAQLYDADFSTNGDGFPDHTTSNPPAPAPATATGGASPNNWVLSYETAPQTDGSANSFSVDGGALVSDDWGGQGIFQSAPIDVSSITAVDISALGTNSGANENNFTYFYILDGGTRVETSINSSNGDAVDYTINGLDVSGASTLIVGFEFSENGGSQGYITNSFTVSETSTECSIILDEVIATCNGDDVVLTINYTASNSTGQVVIIDGGTPQAITNGGTVTITGPTMAMSGVTIEVQDDTDATCNATGTFDQPECPEPAPQVCPTGFTNLAFQSFEDSSGWAFTETPNFDSFSSSSDIWGIVTSMDLTVPTMPTNGDNFVGIQDLDNGDNPTGDVNLVFEAIPVSLYQNVSISFDYSVFGFDTGDDIFYTLTLDGVDQSPVQVVNGIGNFSDSGTETISVPNGTMNVGLTVSISQDGGSDRGGLDNFLICGEPITTPITLSTFTAELQDKSALLKFTTLSEENNDVIEIQRSFNGLDWDKIGEVEGQGTTYEITEYEFTDYNLVNGTTFYQLKQIDFDGTATLSDIVSITTDELADFEIGAVNKQSINITSSLEGNATYMLFNSMGELVANGEFIATKGNQSIYYQSGELAAGFYIVQLNIDGQKHTEKFSVQ